MKKKHIRPQRLFRFRHVEARPAILLLTHPKAGYAEKGPAEQSRARCHRRRARRAVPIFKVVTVQGAGLGHLFSRPVVCSGAMLVVALSHVPETPAEREMSGATAPTLWGKGSSGGVALSLFTPRDRTWAEGFALSRAS